MSVRRASTISNLFKCKFEIVFFFILQSGSVVDKNSIAILRAVSPPKCAQELDHKDQDLLQPVQDCFDKDQCHQLGCLNMPVWFLWLPLKEIQI